MSRVMCFIGSRLSSLYFALERNIINHRDIQPLFFFNRGRFQFLMNIYSNSLHTTVDFLFSKALNISNLLYIEEDFNDKDVKWDPSVSSHPVASQALRDLINSYSLMYSIPVHSVSTHYSSIQDHTNTVFS